MSAPDLPIIVEWFKGLQDRICAGLEQLEEGSRFSEDIWERPEGGGGRSRVMAGKHIEKGGVMFSHVSGEMSPIIAKGLEMDPGHFDATGVSIVLHAANPYVPIIHMNVRYFETEGGIWWFGGGIDVTPHYINKKEASQFHHRLKSVCDPFDPEAYPKFKKWADDYFFNRHRQETRGIGGIFYDRLNEDFGRSKKECWDFTKSVGDLFVTAYQDFFNPNYMHPVKDEALQWRNIRRSRYVEFNLVYDRGTKFGLQTNGRVESILMSMPPEARWVYNYTPASGSEEEATQILLKKGFNWLTDKEG